MEKNTANYISDKGLILTMYKELNSKKRKESAIRAQGKWVGNFLRRKAIEQKCEWWVEGVSL